MDEKRRRTSQKELCKIKIEEMILSGSLSIGQRIPPERDLADQLGISRPIVHEAVGVLASKGLIRVVPRQGCFVNDYRLFGSLDLFSTLVQYSGGTVESELLSSMFELRELFETETAALAAKNRREEHLKYFDKYLILERTIALKEPDRLAEEDFLFHHQIAYASGNFLYPLVLNTFKPIYINLSKRFYGSLQDAEEVFGFHKALVDSIKKRNSIKAGSVMREMLRHGAGCLKGDKHEGKNSF